jgi:AraC-like DNA-binding protein
MSARFKPLQSALVGDMVDAIGKWDVPDGRNAKALAIKPPPDTAILLVAQYRTLVRGEWQLRLQSASCGEYAVSATKNRTSVVDVHPRGPLGAILVYLRPEAAVRILGVPLGEFADSKVDLKNVFSVREVTLLEEMLAEARDSGTRIAFLESFLLRQLRRAEPESLACRAAVCLQRHPALSVRELAMKLDISERHLSRCFRTTFGIGPKRFARTARVEKILAARREGAAWDDIACTLGFADQAHMIRDFNDMVGQSPHDFFRVARTAKMPAPAGSFAYLADSVS